LEDKSKKESLNNKARKSGEETTRVKSVSIYTNLE
jgi:hypothetical protein